LEDAENDLRELKPKRWKEEAINTEQGKNESPDFLLYYTDRIENEKKKIPGIHRQQGNLIDLFLFFQN
jgi:hypothetical protein